MLVESFSVIVLLSYILLGWDAAARLISVALLWISEFILRRRRENRPAAFGGEASISVLICAFNEDVVIEKTIKSILRQATRDFEVIVIDDGSRDSTAAIVARLSRTDDRVTLISNHTNVGKFKSLIRGMDVAAKEIIVTVDADTVVCDGFFHKISAPILSGEATAASGNVRVGNKASFLARLQDVEYVSVLNRTRTVQSAIGTITTIPGAAFAAKAAALREIVNCSFSTLAEDTCLTLLLARQGHSLSFQRDAIAYTEVPTGLRSLISQRSRWLLGNMQCIARVTEKEGGILFRDPSALMFVYENLVKPPLEFARVSIFLYCSIYLQDVKLLALCGVGMLLGTLNVQVASSLDRSAARSPFVCLAKYWVWPVFNIVPFVVALWRLRMAKAQEWHKIRRTGDVPELNLP